VRVVLAAFSAMAALLSAIPAQAQTAVQVPLFDGALVISGEVEVTESVVELDAVVVSFWRPVLFGTSERPIGGRMDCRLGGVCEAYSDALFDIEQRYMDSRERREQSGLNDNRERDYAEEGPVRRLLVTGIAHQPVRRYVLTYIALREGDALYEVRMNCEFKYLHSPPSDTVFAAVMLQYVDLAIPVAGTASNLQSNG